MWFFDVRINRIPAHFIMPMPILGKWNSIKCLRIIVMARSKRIGPKPPYMIHSEISCGKSMDRLQLFVSPFKWGGPKHLIISVHSYNYHCIVIIILAFHSNECNKYLILICYHVYHLKWFISHLKVWCFAFWCCCQTKNNGTLTEFKWSITLSLWRSHYYYISDQTSNCITMTPQMMNIIRTYAHSIRTK